ncbi:MAG: hypothetical protein M1827_004440 [Pycnora praestabilis]|nr:MAG: hypothetical protein M1827_004440 [Pycnora praestabilis]
MVRRKDEIRAFQGSFGTFICERGTSQRIRPELCSALSSGDDLFHDVLEAKHISPAMESSSKLLPQLDFINYTEAPRQNEHRARVRKHVMQNFHRDRRWRDNQVFLDEVMKLDNAAQTVADSILLCQCSISVKERVSHWSNITTFPERLRICRICGNPILSALYDMPCRRAVARRKRRAQYTITSPSIGLFTILGFEMDPFNDFSIELKPYMYRLLSHLFLDVCPTLITIDRKGTLNPFPKMLVPLMMSDEAVMHAVLYIASGHYEAIVGYDNQTTYHFNAYHRFEAIRSISALLRDPARAVSSAALIAVQNVVCYEMFSVDRAALEAHIRGLRAMVELRGGIQNLEGLERRCMEWTDILSTTIIDSMPVFPIIRDPLEQIQAPTLSEPTIETLPFTLEKPLAGTGFKEILISPYMSKEWYAILTDAIWLTIEGELELDDEISMSRIFSFMDRRRTVGHRLLSLQISRDTQQDQCELGDLQNCCRLVALTYTHRVLQDMPIRAALIVHLTDQSRLALTRTNLGKLWGPYVEVLLWVIFLVGADAVEEHARAWCMALLSQIADHLDVKSWVESKGILEKFLWSNVVYGEPCERLWDEMERNKAGYLG